MRPSTSSGLDVALCASCDRCRSRKTKCDGVRPCSNCTANYVKKNRLDSIKHIDPKLFNCVYSPAKRRGPVPGKAGQVRKADAMEQTQTVVKRNGNLLDLALMGPESSTSMMMDQQAQLALLGNRFGVEPNEVVSDTAADQGGNDAAAIHRHFLAQQSNLGRAGMQSSRSAVSAHINRSGAFSSQEQMNLLQQQIQLQQQQLAYEQIMIKEMRPTAQASSMSNASIPSENSTGAVSTQAITKIVTKHLSLLEKSSIDGNRLRSYYELSIDGLNRLPPVPSDEEYCTRLGGSMNPSMLPRFDLAALRAARFAEIALGALVNDQEVLSFELSKATITCLRQCVEDPIHPSCVYDVARAYYLHGLFRCYKGDLVRYFKYRRVCLTHLSQTDSAQGIDALLAAISFHDSWAYMMYNANEDALPPIDDIIPPLSSDCDTEPTTAAETKYKTSTNPHAVINACTNQMWMQGAPPVFINNEAPPLARCLDALACAIRSSCDKANYRLNDTSKDTEMNANNETVSKSVTTLAVTANENELCCRNMVLSAFTLLEQYESHQLSIDKNQGYHMIIAALDAFLEDGDKDEPGDLSDSQIQSLLHVCNTSIEHPYLLFQPGPTYHIVCNSAILLCHLLNGLHANGDATGKDVGGMEAALFDTVLDTFLSVRKILNMHSAKLSVNLRCHSIPRPGLIRGVPNEEGMPFIDLGCTIMCPAKGCQTFVLMGCSPYVASERGQNASSIQLKKDLSMIVEIREHGGTCMESPLQSELSDLRTELDVDDESLLTALSRIISS